MFTVYSDKTDIFECKINLEGASLEKSIARLVIESNDYNIMLYGNITKGGTCKIPILKLKTLLPENATGTIKLEVIADDTFFVPWKSPFELKAAKTVTVEVVEKQTPVVKAKVQISEISSTKTPAVELSELLASKGITRSNFTQNTKIIPIIKQYITESGIGNIRDFINEVVENLK